jgi:hypothetical protein
MPVNYDRAVSRALVFDRARNRDLEFDAVSRAPRESPARSRVPRDLGEFLGRLMLLCKRWRAHRE